MKLALALALALLPATVNWLGSRRLLARLDAADLPERLWRHRLLMVRMAAVSMVLVAVVARYQALWLVPLMATATLTAGFRLRRALFEESWSLAGYLAFQARLYGAFLGFWILLALTPGLLLAITEPYRWPAAAALGGLLLLWSLRFPRVFTRIVGATPLAGDDLEPFRERFARIEERSSAPAPELFQVPVNGGVLVNAVALPSTRRPAVVFWRPLLELLEPEEVAAVYAHEIAHLEQYPARRLLRLAAVEWGLVLLAPLLPVLLADGGALWGQLGLFWGVLVLGVYLVRVAGSRRREADADLRAVDLCGDAEALARALTRLHVLARLPRRVARAQEEQQSHPSLARRLQAIRRAAGPADDAGERDGPAALLPRAIATAEPGGFVVFEADRVSRLEGVAPEAGDNPRELARAAGSVRTLAYGRLAELRVAPRSRGQALVAKELGGGGWSVPLAAESVVEVQQVLDAVDERLGTPTEARWPWATVLRALAGLGVLLSLLPPPVLSLLLPALWCVARPRPASAAAFGAAGVAAALLRLELLPELDVGLGIRWPASLPLLFAAVAALGVAAVRARRDPGRRSEGARLTALIHGSAAALVVLGALLVLFRAGAVGAFSLHQAASYLPGLVVLPLAAAAALVVARGRIAAGLALVAVGVAAASFGVSRPAFERAFVADPLIAAGSLPPAGVRALEEIVRRPVAADTVNLRLSPGGRTWAATGYRQARVISEPPDLWRVGSIDGGAEVELRAADLRFLDERRVLLLIEGEGDELATWTLERRWVDGAEPPTVVAQLEGLAGARLEVEPGTGRWWVTGPPADVDAREELVRFAGGPDGGATRREGWGLPQTSGASYVIWTPAWSEAAVGARWVLPAEAGGWSALAAPIRGERHQLWWMEGESARMIVASRLDALCYAAPFGPPAALCLTHHRGRSHLWRLTAPAGSPPSLEPVARLPGGFAVGAEWSAGSALVWSTSRLWRWDRESGAVEQLIPPEEAASSAVALAESGLVGTLQLHEGEPLLIVYRPGERR